jgi:hypothetical protein
MVYALENFVPESALELKLRWLIPVRPKDRDEDRQAEIPRLIFRGQKLPQPKMGRRRAPFPTSDGLP